MLLEILRIQLIVIADGTDVADSRLGRLLHNISKLSGQFKFSFTRHKVHFDLQCISAYAGPCQTADNPHLIVLSLHVGLIDTFSQIFLQITLRDLNLLPVLLQNLPVCFSAQGSDPSLQCTYTGFSGILMDDLLHRLLTDLESAFIQSMLLHLLLHQMLRGDMVFFIFSITTDLDDLHTVKQRSRYGAQIICCTDKHHF